MTGPAPVRKAIRGIFRIALRYIVAGALFHSGMRMALNLAGTDAGPVEWLTPLGELSGARFAGIWLGISPVFQTLGGLVEIAGGLLLLGRRTTTLGAMVAVGCFTNALMLHLCFPPSPWLADALVLLAATGLVLLDWRMLIDLLLLDRPTTPMPARDGRETPTMRTVGRVLKTSVLLYFVYASGIQSIRIRHDMDALSELSGAYSVASFSPSDAAPSRRWQAVGIDRHAERLMVRMADGRGTTFRIQPLVAATAPGYRAHVAAVDESDGGMTLVAPDGAVSHVRCSRVSPAQLLLSGNVGGVAITADLRVTAPDRLPFENPALPFAEPR